MAVATVLPSEGEDGGQRREAENFELTGEDSGGAAKLEPEKTSLSSLEKKLLFSLEDNLELEVLGLRLVLGEADLEQVELQELLELTR